MARFRFALQRVLDRRLKEEEAKKLVVATVERHRRELEDSLRTRQREIAGGRDEWRAQLVGTIDPASLRHHAGAAIGLMHKAQRTVLELASTEKAMQRARTDLTEAARARRALELLRDRRRAAFDHEVARREREQIDEFAQISTQRRLAGDDFAARTGEPNNGENPWEAS
jgi:flagellar FliJ protein